MNIFWKDEPSVQEFLARVTELVRAAVTPASFYIRPTLIELAENRGKMLRPAMIHIASLSGKAAEENREDIERFAAAMEMLHMASLIHDDVIDNSLTRRGMPTIQARAGVKQAVIAGDYLLTRAFTQLSSRHEQISPDIVKNSICRLCDSEIDQDSELWDFSITRPRYLRRIAGKTASLFSLSLYIGAAAAGCDEQQQLLLRRIGYEIGMFFQIQDDILDYTGKESSMGKPSANDLRCGLATLPLICALRRDSDGRLKRLLPRKKTLSSRQAERIIRKVVELGGVEETAHAGEFYRRKAVADIACLGEGETARLLLLILDTLENRSS
jgi:heptaprenyl diphosphate synthase